MRRLKTTLTILLAAALLLVLIVALFWKQLLTPEQKLRYGLTFEATQQLQRQVAAQSGEENLALYVDALIQSGNLGRALYLIELHGAPYDEAKLSPLRAMLDKVLEEGANGQVYKLVDDPALEPYKETPLMQAMLYLQGYHHALAGDWASARNYFNVVEQRFLAPPLHPYLLYYQARAYRLAGSAEERAQVEALYEELLAGDAPDALKARARYNLLAWYLSDAYGGADGLERALQVRNDIPGEDYAAWARIKSDTELANYYWARDDRVAALEPALQAIGIDPLNVASAAAGELIPLALDSVDAATAASLELPDQALRDLATSAVAHQYVRVTLAGVDKHAELLHQLFGAGELAYARGLMLAAGNNAAGLSALLSSADFAALSPEDRAVLRFEYGGVLARRGEYNAALAEYRQVADGGGELAPAALYARYAIMKEVQEPLNQQLAVELLTQIAEKYPESAVAPKAIEELLPLLIYRGSHAKARELAEHAALEEFAPAEGEDAQAAAAGFDQLRDVAQFWLAYLDHQSGDSGAAQQHRGAVKLQYWGYYELTALADPMPAVEPGPLALDQPENAGEYLAGLGLVAEAQEYYDDAGASDDQLLLFHTLLQWSQRQELPALQYNATLLLEQGRIREAELLDYALELAYPRPFADEVSKAASASGVDPALIYAVMKKESDFKPAAQSGVGATGLMQLMPATAQFLTASAGLPADAYRNLTDPATNIRLGAAYLGHLRSQLAGQVAPAGPRWASADVDDPAMLRAQLHSYNGGPGNYGKWRGSYPNADAVLLADLVPNEENEGFAKRVWKFYLIYHWLLGREDTEATPASP